MKELNVLEVVDKGLDHDDGPATTPEGSADGASGFPPPSSSGSSSATSSTSEDKNLRNLLDTPAAQTGGDQQQKQQQQQQQLANGDQDQVDEARGAVGSSDEDLAEDSKLGLDDFEILKVLGMGAFGKVFQVRKKSLHDRQPGKDKIYALKAMKKSRILASKTDIRHTKAERNALAAVSHPFVVKLHCAFETKDRLYLVQEFCCGGELFRRLEMEQLMMEEDALFYLTEIVLALDYLHSKDIVYRDLKTENVMLDANGHIKLVDFGFCKMNMGDGVLTKTFCGTVEYMAPEVILNESGGYGKPADWWSLGIFTFDLLTGRSPFYSNQGKTATKDKILRGKFPTPRIMTPDANDFVRRLLRRNVSKRLGFFGAKEVKNHPLFIDVDWGKVLRQECVPPFLPKMRNAADVQNFDTIFTSRTPRESSSSSAPDPRRDNGAEPDPDDNDSVDDNETQFEDFYYESEEFAAIDQGKVVVDQDEVVDKVTDGENGLRDMRISRSNPR